MNYGMGGIISLHTDSYVDMSQPIPEKIGNTEHAKYGFARYITFMLYLTDVIAGGHTVFPQSGISVKPVQGAALYWITQGPNMANDARSLHLGCPVLYGNKWIKFLPQFRFYPCSKREHFSVLGNL